MTLERSIIDHVIEHALSHGKVISRYIVPRFHHIHEGKQLSWITAEISSSLDVTLAIVGVVDLPVDRIHIVVAIEIPSFHQPILNSTWTIPVVPLACIYQDFRAEYSDRIIKVRCIINHSIWLEGSANSCRRWLKNRYLSTARNMNCIKDILKSCTLIEIVLVRLLKATCLVIIVKVAGILVKHISSYC